MEKNNGWNGSQIRESVRNGAERQGHGRSIDIIYKMSELASNEREQRYPAIAFGISITCLITIVLCCSIFEYMDKNVKNNLEKTTLISESFYEYFIMI